MLRPLTEIGLSFVFPSSLSDLLHAFILLHSLLASSSDRLCLKFLSLGGYQMRYPFRYVLLSGTEHDAVTLDSRCGDGGQEGSPSGPERKTTALSHMDTSKGSFSQLTAPELRAWRLPRFSQLKWATFSSSSAQSCNHIKEEDMLTFKANISLDVRRYFLAERVLQRSIQDNLLPTFSDSRRNGGAACSWSDVVRLLCKRNNSFSHSYASDNSCALDVFNWRTRDASVPVDCQCYRLVYYL